MTRHSPVPLLLRLSTIARLYGINVTDEQAEDMDVLMADIAWDEFWWRDGKDRGWWE